VLAALLGSFCGTLGGQLRICSLTCKGRVALSLQVLGWTFWVVGQGLGQVGILLAPATIAACVTFSGSLLCNALLAPIVLHEHLTRLHGLGVVLLTTGGTLVTLSSDHSSPEYSWAELSSFWHRPVFLAAAAGCLSAALVILAVAARRAHLAVWSFAFLFALCGSVDLLVAKYTLELLRICAGGRQSSLPSSAVVLAYTALMLLLHVATFLFQVASAYYRKALQSMPLFLGSGCIVQVSLCGIFFEEFGGFTGTRTFTFLSGLALVIAGMLVTSHAAPAQAAPESPTGEQRPHLSDLSEEAVAEIPSFNPPTGNSPNRAGSPWPPIISSGLLARNSSSLSSADFVFLGEIQRSAMCFRGQYNLTKSPVGLQRKFESAPLFQPLLAAPPSPPSRGRGRAINASAPPMVGPTLPATATDLHQSVGRIGCIVEGASPDERTPLDTGSGRFGRSFASAPGVDELARHGQDAGEQRAERMQGQ